MSACIECGKEAERGRKGFCSTCYTRQWRHANRDRPKPPVREHGAYGYGLGCRCKVCKAGKQKIAGASRRALRGKTPNKHGIYGYRVYGCRCKVCVGARNEERDRARVAERASWRGHYHNDAERGVTVVHWPPRELDEPWLCPDCDFKVIPA